MRKEARKVMFDLYNTNWVDEKKGERGVGFIYVVENGVKKDYDQKLERLMNDYPESEGYELTKRSDKFFCTLD